MLNFNVFSPLDQFEIRSPYFIWRSFENFPLFNLLSSPIPRSHQFIKLVLVSEFSLISFRLIYKTGDVIINVISPIEYLDYVKSLGKNLEICLKGFNNFCTKSYMEMPKLQELATPNVGLLSKKPFSGINSPEFTHLFLDFKSKFPNINYNHIYCDSLNSIWSLLHSNPQLFYLLVPITLYRILPYFHQHLNAYVYTENNRPRPRRTRLQQLNDEFTNRYNTIMNNITIARNNWASYWNFVESLRAQGLTVTFSPRYGDIDIILPNDASAQLTQSANRLSTQSDFLVGQLVDAVDLLARNRFTAWVINLEDPTFIGNDEVLIHDITPILNQTQDLYNVFDFEQRLEETYSNLINTYRANHFGANNSSVSKRNRSEAFEDDSDEPSSSKKNTN